MKPIATTVIDIYEKAVVYGALNGETTQTKIEQTFKISQATISGWLASFVQAGLCTQPNEFYKNYRALFTLQELGINPADLKKRAKTSSKEIGSTQSETQPAESQEVS
jgi:transposase